MTDSQTVAVQSSAPLPSRQSTSLIRLLLLGNLAALALIAYAVRSEASTGASLHTRQTRCAAVAADAAIVQQAAQGAAPRQPSSGTPESADNFTGVAAFLPTVLQKAGADASKLLSVIPEAPRPIADTGLVRVGERVSFEDIGLEQLIQIAQSLRDARPGSALDLISLRTARSKHPEHWDAEIVVASVVPR